MSEHRRHESPHFPYDIAERAVMLQKITPIMGPKPCTCPSFDGRQARSFFCPVHGEDALHRHQGERYGFSDFVPGHS